MSPGAALHAGSALHTPGGVTTSPASGTASSSPPPGGGAPVVELHPATASTMASFLIEAVISSAARRLNEQLCDIAENSCAPRGQPRGARFRQANESLEGELHRVH